MGIFELLYIMMLVVWYLIFIAVYLYVFVNSDRPSKIKNINKKVESLPSYINPGNLSNLLYNRIEPEALTSTILILVKKGILRIQTVEGKKTIYINRNNNLVLSSSQKYAIKLIIDYIGDGNYVTFDQINNYNDSNANSSHFYINYQIWLKMMIKETSNMNYYELKSQHNAITNLKYASILLFAFNFFEQFRYPLGFFIILPGIYLSYYYFDSYRRTKEGQEEFETWIAYKKYLESLNNADDVALVYAPLLRIENINQLDPDNYIEELNTTLKNAIAKAEFEGRKGSII